MEKKLLTLIIVLAATLQSLAQITTIKGRVLDAITGEGLIGASLVPKSTTSSRTLRHLSTALFAVVSIPFQTERSTVATRNCTRRWLRRFLRLLRNKKEL